MTGEEAPAGPPGTDPEVDSAANTAADIEAVLPDWLLNAITDFMMLQMPSPAGRAAIICELVDEMKRAADWFARSAPAEHEMNSLGALRQQAHEHLLRMMAKTLNH